MLPQETDAALTNDAIDEAQGDLMEDELSTNHSPLHMRNDSSTHSAGLLFSNFDAAIEYSQNGVVLLQRDFMLTEQIVISTPGLTLDLGGHTLVVGDQTDKHAAPGSMPSLLSIETSGVKICNGHILISASPLQGISVRGECSKVDLLLEDVDITYKGGGYALMVLAGSVVLIDSSIGTKGSGIHLADKTSSVSMLRSRILSAQCGISMWDGRLFLDDCSVQGHHAYGLFIKSGWTDVTFSSITSSEAQALATRAVSSKDYTLMVRIRNRSQLDSESANAMLLQGGAVSVLGSMLRSMKDSAIKMGVADAGFDVPMDVLASTRLSLLDGSTISAWQGDGVHRGVGKLLLHESCEIKVSGKAVVDDEVPNIVQREEAPGISIAAQVENPNAPQEGTRLEVADGTDAPDGKDAAQVLGDGNTEAGDQSEAGDASGAGDVPGTSDGPSAEDQGDASDRDGADEQSGASDNGDAAGEAGGSAGSDAASTDGVPGSDGGADEDGVPGSDGAPGSDGGADAEGVPGSDGKSQDASDDPFGTDADFDFDFGEGDEDPDGDFLTEMPILGVSVDNVHMRLDYRKPVEFTARLTTSGGRTDQAEILFEQWSDGTDVITSDETHVPTSDSTYHYILALRAKDGYVFPNYFDVVYKGESVGHSVMISMDRKIAMVSWGLTVTVTRNRRLGNPLAIVRSKKDN